MIKLESLHQGDVIYQVYKYHWISKIQIISNLKLFEYQSRIDIINHTEVYCIEGLSTLDLNKNNFIDFENLFKDDEKSLYKTLEEAEKVLNKTKQDRIMYLQKDNNLLKELYNQTECLPIIDKEIYKQLISNCTVIFNKDNK